MFKFKQKMILSGILLFALVFACNKTEYFDKELYHNTIYIVSGVNNVDEEEFSFDTEVSIRNISFGSSGTKAIEEDITIEVETDDVLLPIFNKKTFDDDVENYARILNPSLYTIGNSKIVLKKGENNVLLPVSIKSENLEKLSPDSIYFIPLAIKSVSGQSVNELKKNVLLRVFSSNKYAQTKKKTYYALKGYKIDTLGNTYTNSFVTSSSKIITPLSKNEIRILIGNTNIGVTPSLEDINKNSIVLKVNNDNTVNVRAYDNEESYLKIEQLDKPKDDPNFVYLNTYEVNNDRERFMLYYRYKTYDKIKNVWSRWFYMKEDLRKLE